MFSGIIEGAGRVVSLAKRGRGARLSIKSPLNWGRMKKGESVAVDGCCLTLVERKGDGKMVFDVSGETLRRTKMGNYRFGQKVNLERPLKLGDRLGGHLVLGHVDGTGKIRSIQRKERHVEMEIEAPMRVFRYVTEKGSVAIDGVSLTAGLVRRRRFKVFLIPATLKATNLSERKVDDSVNLEGDVLGKLVESLISSRRGGKKTS